MPWRYASRRLTTSLHTGNLPQNITRTGYSSIAWGEHNRQRECQQRPRRHFHASAINLASAKNPYEALGVDKKASTGDIKKAYYALAKKFHPDTNKEPNAKERFVEIQNAYDILSDEKKRANFDQFGSAEGFGPGAGAAGGQGFPGGFGGFGGFGDFGGFQSGSARGGRDIFEDLFGSAFPGARRGGGFSAESMVGDDIQMPMNISFMDAAKGATRKVNISPITVCPPCQGQGVKPGSKRASCPSCGGTGTRVHAMSGGFQMATTCDACGGSGTHIPPGKECDTCGGVGRVRQRKTVEVKIPAGIEDGMRIRLEGEGDAPVSSTGGTGGRRGDAYITISISPSSIFRRQGPHVYHDTTVPMTTAALGGKVRVPTLDGDVELSVPSGTQPGEKMVLRRRGIRKLASRGGIGDERGDQYVTVNVTMPKTLTDRQRELLEQFDEAANNSSRSARSKRTPATSPDQNSDRTETQEFSDKNETSRLGNASNPHESERHDSEKHDSEKGGFFRHIKDKLKDTFDHHKENNHNNDKPEDKKAASGNS